MPIRSEEIREARLRHENWAKNASREEIRKFLERVDPNAKDIPAEQRTSKPRNGKKAKRANA
jgi:uncharacterized protein YdaT